MNKTVKLTVTGFLLLALLGSVILPVCAAGAELTISSPEDFLTFAQNCTLDAYSSGMTVSLTADIDLSGLDFTGVPIFSGTFDGKGHTISGLTLTAKGSSQGLFRCLTEDAVVRNLKVEGTVLPEGSRSAVGGIAGSNAGQIRDCRFSGEVSGSDGAGGIAGVNQVSGVIEGCTVSGSVHGSHFIGGMAGKNFGLIRSCSNLAGINVTAGENHVSLSDISASTITGTESADTVTDAGGIAGTSTGMIRGCDNRGTVGYPHMGYNIGGIAGSQRGFITECTNHGPVCGRKEIAGIVGQMEPVSIIEYTEDTLQILRQQLAGTAALANQAASDVRQCAADLGYQVDSLRGQAETAVEAIHQLLPSKDSPHLPDPDTIHAARNTLSSCMSQMQSSLTALQSGAQNGVGSAADDIRAITAQINAISGTIGTASENLGGTVTDISDSDTADDLTGKVFKCTNHGSVSGDLNIGGIAGAVAWENDLDPEDDFQITSGSQSLNFDSRLRSVILECHNDGPVTAKKRRAGGIVGGMSLGLVKSCTNSGPVSAPGGEYVGGIAGSSAGFIRSCAVRCTLDGETCVGGIAGKAGVVTDCRSLTDIPRGGEKLGSVLGICGESGVETPISGNFYLPVGQALGAIDGISYAGAAQALPSGEFLALADLPPIFSHSTLTFRFENGDKAQLTVPLGGAVPARDIPAVPEKEGQLAAWDGLDRIDPEHLWFDLTLEPAYTPCQQVLSSTLQRENGNPVLLAEGLFSDSTGLELEAAELPVPERGMTALEAWKNPRLSDGESTYHLALPEALSAEDAAILMQAADGTWSRCSSKPDGSYLVFQADAEDLAFCLVKTNAREQKTLILILTLLAVVILAVIVVLIVRRRKKKSRK